MGRRWVLASHGLADRRARLYSSPASSFELRSCACIRAGRWPRQLIGWVGPIANGELHQARYAGVPSGAIVGQSGLEYTYDQALRQGNDVRISLDPALQRVGEQALATAIARNPPASGGASVAINPQNGEIYAIGIRPDLRRGRLHPTDLGRRRADVERSRVGQSAGESRDRERRPGRLDVHADHRARGVAERRVVRR